MAETPLRVAIDRERARRRGLAASGNPYRYWGHRGQADGRRRVDDIWCDWCQGFFGAVHHHEPGRLCSLVYHWGGKGCACIDCEVADRLSEKADVVLA